MSEEKLGLRIWNTKILKGYWHEHVTTIKNSPSSSQERGPAILLLLLLLLLLFVIALVSIDPDS